MALCLGLGTILFGAMATVGIAARASWRRGRYATR